ncbi:hypothetical protein T440DRAFT_536825 [Plenodomus tracheiphilus IPT5]|uniref:Uncharacterized protein n=1 Tax=Plenodomus tracheiphilus IPT5 TaxID=1408161 RepID=A0A6A7B1J3_9PLEO|nr:hypothetical protein T440DRAFT_536825 [Plenodomus tracheiphilus IPT5]
MPTAIIEQDVAVKDPASIILNAHAGQRTAESTHDVRSTAVVQSNQTSILKVRNTDANEKNTNGSTIMPSDGEGELTTLGSTTLTETKTKANESAIPGSSLPQPFVKTPQSRRPLESTLQQSLVKSPEQQLIRATRIVHNQSTQTSDLDNQLLAAVPVSIDKTSRFVTFQKMERTAFAVGDIAWYPILRPSNDPSYSDLETKHGKICAKIYPVIVVAKLEDCMICVPILTAGDRGLENKPASIRARSTYVVTQGNLRTVPQEFILEPRVVFEVSIEKSKLGILSYSPSPNAFVDVLDHVQISYDSRFKKEVCLTPKSTGYIVAMRAIAALFCARPCLDLHVMVYVSNWWQKRIERRRAAMMEATKAAQGSKP